MVAVLTCRCQTHQVEQLLGACCGGESVPTVSLGGGGHASMVAVLTCRCQTHQMEQLRNSYADPSPRAGRATIPYRSPSDFDPYFWGRIVAHGDFDAAAHGHTPTTR
jgi:hypothetical protein